MGASIPSDATASRAEQPAAGLATHVADVLRLHAQAAGLELQSAAGEVLVHDLRVAIRRVRSLAQGLAAVDVSETRRWRALSDLGRPLFQGLGALRDAQVMRGWVASHVDGEAADAWLGRLDHEIALQARAAAAVVAAFDPAAFQHAAAFAPARAALMLRRRPLLSYLALVRLDEAVALHEEALRTGAAADLHDTRIGVKRLRYTLESLLPDVLGPRRKHLKQVQDALGDIHDLDVLLDRLSPTGAEVAAQVDARGAKVDAKVETGVDVDATDAPVALADDEVEPDTVTVAVGGRASPTKDLLEPVAVPPLDEAEPTRDTPGAMPLARDHVSLSRVHAHREALHARYLALTTGAEGLWAVMASLLPSDPSGRRRCRGAYVVEVAAAIGVSHATARRARRVLSASARAAEVEVDDAMRWAAMLAPGWAALSRRRRRQLVRRLLGFSRAERRALRSLLRDQGARERAIVHLAGAAARLQPDE